MRKTYMGSCHCGAVRFQVDLDLSQGTTRCNYTFCTKAGLWSAQVAPEQFSLLAGRNDLSDYRGRNEVAHHLFCQHCGVRPYEWVDVPNMSGAKYVSVNVLCLDELDRHELMAAPVTYADGLNDDWGSTPRDLLGL